jgi:hypothetical protein
LKQITLRAFRDAIADQTEPVTVVRNNGGVLETVGTWYPTGVFVAGELLRPPTAVTPSVRKITTPNKDSR